MTNPLNLSDLFLKLNDLKTVFHNAQKLIPVIQNMIDFMQETLPMLENINNSISESTAKIPRATTQINSITSATELATTEILDLVDIISGDMVGMEKSLNDFLLKEKEEKIILQQLRAETSGNENAISLLNKLERSAAEKEKFLSLIFAANKVKEDAYRITLSLQVQDITTQQLSAVNHLIESVQTRLSSLIINIDDAMLEQLDCPADYPVEAAFNPGAVYSKSGSNQMLADSLVFEQNNASQEEIDRLFR
jgi:chemotaxis regulatin CheY-phosphate phosphatase CheZ